MNSQTTMIYQMFIIRIIACWVYMGNILSYISFATLARIRIKLKSRSNKGNQFSLLLKPRIAGVGQKSPYLQNPFFFLGTPPKYHICSTINIALSKGESHFQNLKI